MNYELLIDAIEDIHPAVIAFGIGAGIGLAVPELGVVRIAIIATIVTGAIKLLIGRVADTSGKDSDI